MKRFLFFLLPLLLVSAVLRAEDDFRLLQQQLQAVLAEWNRFTDPQYRSLLKDSGDPKARTRLRLRPEPAENFAATSMRLQKIMKNLPPADDLSLARHAENLRATLQLCAGAIENKAASKSLNHNEVLSFALMLVQRDMAFLREIGFTCQDGTAAVSPEVQAWPDLYRYKRQLEVVKLCMKENPKEQELRMTAQKRELRREFSTILQTAEQLGCKVGKAFPDLVDAEVLLPVMTRKLLEESGISGSPSKMKMALPEMSDSETKSYKPAERLQQINCYLRTIETRIRLSMLKKEKSKNVKSSQGNDRSEAVSRRTESVRPEKKSEPATRQKKQQEIPLERRSDEELNKELLLLRQQILPDANRKTLTSDELKQCLDLLSEREQKQYETIRSRWIRNGSDQYEATLEALKELKELLTAPDAVFPSKQEKIRILKKAAGK